MGAIPLPVLVINFKNYHEVFDSGALELTKVAQNIAGKLKVSIVVCPPTPSIAEVCRSVSIPVLAQHVDTEKPGSSTGAIIPEVLKSYGVRGSLINHSEKRIPILAIRSRVERLRSVGMLSLSCARSPEEVSRIAGLGPDWLAVEPPELIGSGRAVSKVNPKIITDSLDACGLPNSGVALLCGAGIVTGEDVSAAIKLGARGVLVSSGIVRAKDWDKTIEELAGPLG